MWAVKPKSNGKVSARRFKDKDLKFVLAEGEFLVAHYEEGMVIAENGQSVRFLTESETLAQENAAKIMAIKAEASRRITSIYPEWKQRNMTARMLEFVKKGQENWTANERKDATQIEAAWAWVKSVRETSNTLEQTLPENHTDDYHWPTPL